jgi:hypothetical protein
MNRGSKGAAIAAAVAMMFAASSLFAQEPSGGMSSPGASMAKVKCLGANDCRGKGSCKSAGQDYAGKNSCKGKGFVDTSTAKECKAMGGKPAKMKGMKM